MKGSYWYQRKYGITLAYFDQRGSGDNIAYPITGRPNTNGYVAELNYMIQPYWRAALQYTGYGRYQGTRSNYDGNGRNASDNNTWYLAAGRTLYQSGNAEKGTPACAACHGANAEGGAAGPRPAGQHSAYVTGHLSE